MLEHLPYYVVVAAVAMSAGACLGLILGGICAAAKP